MKNDFARLLEIAGDIATSDESETREEWRSEATREAITNANAFYK